MKTSMTSALAGLMLVLLSNTCRILHEPAWAFTFATLGFILMILAGISLILEANLKGLREKLGTHECTQCGLEHEKPE